MFDLVQPELGQDAMIDHLVEEYGVDPNGEWVELRWTALHNGQRGRGRVRTVKHLVEKHNVDIHKRGEYEQTALDLAEVWGMTECAAYLRALQSHPPSPFMIARPDPDRTSRSARSFVVSRL